jgi:hypothetical protein
LIVFQVPSRIYAAWSAIGDESVAIPTGVKGFDTSIHSSFDAIRPIMQMNLFLTECATSVIARRISRRLKVGSRGPGMVVALFNDLKKRGEQM